MQVSIIMPVYNGGKYLETAVASVAAQEIEAELIIINDCSTDNTKEIIADCREKYNNISIIEITNKTNLGVSKSRNKGVNIATGATVAFLDCDDYWEQNKLNLQLKLMQETGRVLCCTAREFITDVGQLTGKIVPVKDVITYRDLLKFNSISLSSALLKTEVAREFPMKFDDCHEDYIMWLSVLKKYGEADGINSPLLKYRKSAAAKTSNKLKSALMHYKSLRKSGINPIKAAFLFTQYAVNGIKNHL